MTETPLQGETGLATEAKEIAQLQNEKNNFFKLLYSATVENLSNWSSAVTYFCGPIYQLIPHVRSIHPLGHLFFTKKTADKFTQVALKKNSKGTSQGIVTYWSGPSFPAHYIANNAARHAFVRESHVGVVDEASWELLKTLSGGNKVMSTFPAFRPIDSETYQAQRTFLLKRFHGGAKKRLPQIAEITTAFLKRYCEKPQNPLLLREFIILFVLHASSHLLGLSQITLDVLYSENEKFCDAIHRVAKYGISDRLDHALEETLYQFFICVLQGNFEQIYAETSETNLIRNIFDSMNEEFPEKMSDFEKFPKEIRDTIAMNFASTGIGAMVHSTANSLDWAIARLLKDQNKLNEFVQLMEKHKHLDLTEEHIFDKDKGQLFPICAWVLHNVFLYPTFSHEFFLNRKPSSVILADGCSLSMPGKSFIVVNYAECNRSNDRMTSALTFPDELAKQATTGRFIMDKRVASFGGSIISKDNPWTRVCPGAKTSLLEQMIMISTILRDCTVLLTDPEKISCAIDHNMHPICARVNTGHVIITPKLAADVKLDARHNNSCMKNINRFFNQIKSASSFCDTKKAKKLLCTGVTIGAAIAIHTIAGV